jgi:phage-related protein
MFYARNFIFNDIPSEFFGLYLGEFNGGGDATTATSSDVQLLTQKLFRKPVPLFWGAEQTPVLSFPLAMYSERELTAVDFSEISTWLYGQQNYKELRICQNDMPNVYFNAFLTAPQIVRTGNMIQGTTCTVVCDSPWGWREPKYYDYSWGDNTYQIDDTITFFNESANGFYTYPSELVIHGNIFGGSVTITNVTDNNRQFILTLLPEEVVTLDCEHQFISSTLVQYPLINFNKKWLRFLPGENNLIISGNISEIEITSPIAFKVGG